MIREMDKREIVKNDMDSLIPFERPPEYLVVSDFDQTLSFNDSGLILSEMLGISRFQEKVDGLSRSTLVNQGAELAYLLRHDPEFRSVRREHLIAAGKRVPLKDNVDLFARILRGDLSGNRFRFYVISAAPREVVQSALEGIVPPENIFGTEFRCDPTTNEIADILRVPAGYGKIAVLQDLETRLQSSPDRTIYVGDGSSDLYVMHHVNSHDGHTVAVSESKSLGRIAKRTVLSENALSVLVPILEDLGLALLALAMGAVLGMPLTGWFIARGGSERPTRVAAFLFCVALPFLALHGSAPAFVLTLGVVGLVHGILDVAMNAQAVEVEEGYPHPIMSSFHALFSAGGLAGAASGAGFAALDFGPFAHFLAVASAFGIVVFLASPHLLASGRPGARTSSPRARTGFALPSSTLLALGALALCTMVGEGAMADWGALYLRDIHHTSESFAAAGYAAFSVAMAVARIFGDRLIASFSPIRMARLGGGSAAAGLLVALFVPSPLAALAGFAGVGLGLATLVPMVFSAAGRTPGTAPGVALSTVTTLGYLGFIAGPPLIGLVAELVGLRGALGLIVATSLCSVALAPALGPPQTRRRSVAHPGGGYLQVQAD